MTALPSTLLLASVFRTPLAVEKILTAPVIVDALTTQLTPIRTRTKMSMTDSDPRLECMDSCK